MAAAEARAVWQRTATNRAVQEDVVKAPKLAHCPSLKKQDSHSYYLGSSWGSMDTKVDLPRQLNPSTHRDYRSDYLGVEAQVSAISSSHMHHCSSFVLPRCVHWTS
jgi:uncharacterized membrane protein